MGLHTNSMRGEQNSGCCVQQQTFAKNTPPVMGQGVIQRLLQTRLQIHSQAQRAFSAANAQASSLQESLLKGKDPKTLGRGSTSEEKRVLSLETSFLYIPTYPVNNKSGCLILPPTG